MTKLLIDIPEVPEGSKTCGECPHLKSRMAVCRCRMFRNEHGLDKYLDGHYPKGPQRCPACLAAESAALELLRIKAEKDEEDKTWK